MMRSAETGPQNPDAQLKSQMRKLMAKFHPDKGIFKGAEAETIMRVLAACRDASTTATYGDLNNPKTWQGTWDMWRGRGKPLSSDEEFIRLIRDAGDGTLIRSERTVRLPNSPREFIHILQNFADTGALPPETPQERQEREKAESATTSRREWKEWQQQSQEQESPRERRSRERDERAAHEEQQREQQRAERDRQERERAERAQRERDEEERRARAEREQAERAERERAERETRRPENVFARRIESASTMEHFKGILKDIELAFASQGADYPDSIFWDGTYEYLPDSIFLRGRYEYLRFGEIPRRVAALYRAEVANAIDVRGLKNVYANIIRDGFFKDAAQLDALSPEGEILLGRVYEHAELVFRAQIENAQFRAELADIEQDMQRFFGGPLNEARIFTTSHGPLGPLASADRAKMTREQSKRYDRGERAPRFSGPLSEAEKAAIALESGIVSFGSATSELADVVRSLADLLEQKKESIWRSRLPKAPRRAA
jgi:hypothetical protein